MQYKFGCPRLFITQAYLHERIQKSMEDYK